MKSGVRRGLMTDNFYYRHSYASKTIIRHTKRCGIKKYIVLNSNIIGRSRQETNNRKENKKRKMKTEEKTRIQAPTYGKAMSQAS